MINQCLIDGARSVLERCIKSGASDAEVFLLQSQNLHLEVDKGEMDVMKDAEDRLLSIRVLIGHRLGFAYCTDFSTPSLDTVIDQVMMSAKNSDEDRHCLFPSPQKGSVLTNIDQRLSAVSVKEKFRRCQDIEKVAYQADKRIKAARQVSYSENIAEVFLINSLGVEVTFGKSACSTFAMVVAQDDSGAQMAWEMDIQTSYDNLRWEDVGREAARKALALLGARSIKTQKSAVALSPTVSISILGAFADAFYADSVQKGRSLMAGRLEERVASGVVNLIDDGTYAGGLATAPYDGEGVPMQKKGIIKEGVLKTFLYDTYTGHKAGVPSTGNGVRQSPKSQPQVGATNMFIERGRQSEESLLATVEECFYVTEIMGAHTINPISGDFSVGANGYWLERGQNMFPVSGVTLSGNMLDLFNNISGCADNLRFFGPFGSPTLMVSEMIISGEGDGR